MLALFNGILSGTENKLAEYQGRKKAGQDDNRRKEKLFFSG